MKKITKQKWIEALESGKFKQGDCQLRHRQSYCCLGVLCSITGHEYDRDMTLGYPKENSSKDGAPLPFIGLSSKQQEKLANMNDGGLAFKDIADYIKRYVKTSD